MKGQALTCLIIVLLHGVINAGILRKSERDHDRLSEEEPIFGTEKESEKIHSPVIQKSNGGKNKTYKRVAAQFDLSKGKKISTLTNPSNYFLLTFQLFPRGTFDGFGSILRYTNTLNNCCDYGDRWLAMWLRPNSYTMVFVAGSTVNGNPGFDVDGIEANKWNDIKVEAFGDEIKFYINGILKGTNPNTNRPPLDTINVYAGDSISDPADAIIRDFIFTPSTSEITYSVLESAKAFLSCCI